MHRLYKMLFFLFMSELYVKKTLVQYFVMLCECKFHLNCLKLILHKWLVLYSYFEHKFSAKVEGVLFNLSVLMAMKNLQFPENCQNVTQRISKLFNYVGGFMNMGRFVSTRVNDQTIHHFTLTFFVIFRS